MDHLARTPALALCTAVLAGSIAAMPLTAAASVPASQASTAASSEQAEPTASPRGDASRLRAKFSYPKNFGESIPVVIRQPSIQGRTLSIGVRFTAWRTSSRHLASKWDKFQGQIRIAKKSYKIRNVTSSSADAAKIAYKTTSKKKTLRASGTKDFKFKLPKSVAKTLRSYTKKQLLTHVQFVARHWKDVTRVRGYDAQLIGQSDQRPAVKKSRIRSGTVVTGPLKRNPENTQNPKISTDIMNYSPFTLSGSMAGSNCMDGVSTVNATLTPGSTLWGSAYPMVNSGSSDGQSSWKSVTQNTVNTVGATAKTNSGAFEEGIAAATTPGLVGAGTEFATTFLGNMISNIAKNACQNSAQSQTLTMSWTATDYTPGTAYSAADWNEYGTQGPGFGTSQTIAQSGAAITNSVPVSNQLSTTELGLYPGAQSSVQWNWNDGNVNMDGPGASYFSGGLTAISQVWNLGVDGGGAGGLYVGNWTFALTFDDTAVAQYGPDFNSDVTANIGAPSQYPINCVIPSDAELITPFPGASVESFSNPTAGVSLSGNTSASFTQNSGSGWSTVPNSQQVNAGFAGGSSSFWPLQGGYNPSVAYGCALSAAATVPDYPATTGGLQMNLGWLSYPAQTATAQ